MVDSQIKNFYTYLTGQPYAQVLMTGLSKMQKQVRTSTFRKKEPNLRKLKTCFSTCSNDTNKSIDSDKRSVTECGSVAESQK